MKLAGRNILLVSPEPWDHIFVSKHHYAVHLGKRGNRVFFLNPPGNQKSVKGTDHDNVVSVAYEGFPKGLRYYPPRLQRHFIRKRFDELQKLAGVTFDVVWSFDNSVFFNFSALPAQVLKITHIVDLTQKFQMAKAATTADICFGSTGPIVTGLRKYNPNTSFVQHGYKVQADAGECHLPGSHAVKAGYAGNLNLKYIDWELLDRLTARNTQVGFYFAGPYDPGHALISRIQERPNVFFLNRIPSDMLGAFYSRMDVLLLCYRADEYPDQLANPHKMMEYLGSGNMIVATFTAGYKDLLEKGILLMSDKNVELPGLFDKALSDLRFWNGPEKRKLRRDIALENTYDRQIDRIQALLANLKTVY